MLCNKPILLSAACSAALILASSALAETSDPATTVSSVTVHGAAAEAASETATKTSLPLSETPLNVQVVDQLTLQEQAVITLDQALLNVSGVTVGAGGGADNGQAFSSVFIRGFSTDAHFRNGVRFDSFGSDSGTADTQFANIEAVTVLKGPAAILYGAVEPGGMVNVVTKQPQTTPSYSLQEELGSYGLSRTVVDATGPLTSGEALSYRLDGSYETSASPARFIYNHTVFLAPVVRWQASADTQVTLEGEVRLVNRGQNYGFMPLLNGAPFNTTLSTNWGEYSPDRENTFLVGESVSHRFNSDWSIKQSLLFNTVHVNSAGVFPYYVPDNSGSPPPTPSGQGVGRFLNHINGNDYTVSANLDLVGHFTLGPADNTLLFGGDYVRFRYAGAILQAGQVDTNISWIDLYDPVHPGTGFAPGLTDYVASNQDLNTAGLYLQDQATLPHHLHVLVGVREQYIDQAGGSQFGGTVLTPGPSLVEMKATPRLGLLWSPLKAISLYANYARNFGPNNGYSIQPNGQLVPATSAHQWEVGAKSELFQGRLSGTLAYYDLTKTNIPEQDPLNPNFSLVIGEARSRGVEFDVEGRIVKAWRVIFNYAYTDANVTRSDPVALGGTPVGAFFGEVPHNLAHLWTTYEFQTGALKGLKVGGGATYHGSEPWLYINAVAPPLIPDYQTFDLMAAYASKAAGKNFTAQLNLTNIAGKHYLSDVQGFAPPGPGWAWVTAMWGAPREAVLSLRADF